MARSIESSQFVVSLNDCNFAECWNFFIRFSLPCSSISVGILYRWRHCMFVRDRRIERMIMKQTRRTEDKWKWCLFFLSVSWSYPQSACLCHVGNLRIAKMSFFKNWHYPHFSFAGSNAFLFVHSGSVTIPHKIVSGNAQSGDQDLAILNRTRRDLKLFMVGNFAATYTDKGKSELWRNLSSLFVKIVFVAHQK